MEWSTIKWTSLWSMASECLVRDLDIAEGEGQKCSQPKARGHLVLQPIQILH